MRGVEKLSWLGSLPKCAWTGLNTGVLAHLNVKQRRCAYRLVISVWTESLFSIIIKWLHHFLKTKISVMAAVWLCQISRLRQNLQHCYRFSMLSAKSSFPKNIHKSLIHNCKFCLRSDTKYDLNITKFRFPDPQGIYFGILSHEKWKFSNCGFPILPK